MQSEYSTEVRVSIIDLVEKGKDLFYQVMVKHGQRKKWFIDRTFNQFCELHKKLDKKIPNMPILPSKTLFKPTFQEAKKRKIELEKYLNALCFKKDVIANPFFREFVELDDHERADPVVKQLTQIDKIPMEVTQMTYLPYSGIILLGLGETGVMSKIDNLMTSFAGPMKPGSLINGAVVAYGEDPIGSLRFNKLWHKSVESGVVSMYWDDDLTLLAVGLENGVIHLLRIASEHEYEECDEFCVVKQHAATVTGVALIKSTATLISISQDKNLMLTNISDNDPERPSCQKLHMHPLVKMVYDSTKERIFVFDSTGALFIYAAEMPIVLLGVVDFPRQNYVTALYFEPQPGYLFAGSKEGVIAIYELEKPGRERFTQIVGSIETIKEITSLHFIQSNKQMFVSNTMGNVLFVNSTNAASFYTLDAHEKEVGQVAYYEDLKLLITSSKDKTVKFWRYPYDSEKDSGSLIFKSTSMRSQRATERTRGGASASDIHDEYERDYERRFNRTKQKDVVEDDQDDYFTRTYVKPDYSRKDEPGSGHNANFFKRYRDFENDDSDGEHKTGNRHHASNITVNDAESRRKKREAAEQENQFELNSSNRTKIKSTIQDSDEDEYANDVQLPNNSLVKDKLPMPFARQENEESDLRGWEAEEEEEQDPEKIKKSQRPLVAHFRDFPNTAIRNTEGNQNRDPLGLGIKYQDKDEDEDEDDIMGWDQKEDSPKSQVPDANGIIAANPRAIDALIGKGKSLHSQASDIMGEFITPNVKRIKQPESKAFETRDRDEEEELSGWAN